MTLSQFKFVLVSHTVIRWENIWVIDQGFNPTHQQCHILKEFVKIKTLLLVNQTNLMLQKLLPMLATKKLPNNCLYITEKHKNYTLATRPTTFRQLIESPINWCYGWDTMLSHTQGFVVHLRVEQQLHQWSNPIRLISKVLISVFELWVSKVSIFWSFGVREGLKTVGPYCRLWSH